ncbi:unnamed protein product [Alopecurus aequalis]
MAAAVSYRLAAVACTKRSPIRSPPSCATRMRINPACVARPEDAAARNAKRMHGRGEERPRSPDVKRRRRDDVSPDASMKQREIFRHRQDEESQESKRRRRDDARRVSPHGRRKRKMGNVDDARMGSSTSSRSCFGRPRPEKGVEDHMARREVARRTAKIKGREREQDTARRRSRSGSALSESTQTRARPQQQLPVVAVVKPRVFFLDGRPLQEEDYAESFEEAKLRRMETQEKREEARRQLDKVVQTVFFNDPYISYLDVFKR